MCVGPQTVSMRLDLHRYLVLDAAVTVHVGSVLFDGSLGDEGRELRVTGHLHGATHSLSWRRDKCNDIYVSWKLAEVSFVLE